MLRENWLVPYEPFYLRLTNYIHARVRVVGASVNDPTLDPNAHWVVLPKMRTFVRSPGSIDPRGKFYPAGLTSATITEFNGPPVAPRMSSSQATTFLFTPNRLPLPPFPPTIPGWEVKTPCPLLGHPLWKTRRPCINPWHLHGLEPPHPAEFAIPTFLEWASAVFIHLKPPPAVVPSSTFREWLTPTPEPEAPETPTPPPPDPLDGAVEAIETFNAILKAFPDASPSDIERELSATFSSTRVAEIVPLLLSLSQKE